MAIDAPQIVLLRKVLINLEMVPTDSDANSGPSAIFRLAVFVDANLEIVQALAHEVRDSLMIVFITSGCRSYGLYRSCWDGSALIGRIRLQAIAIYIQIFNLQTIVKNEVEFRRFHNLVSIFQALRNLKLHIFNMQISDFGVFIFIDSKHIPIENIKITLGWRQIREKGHIILNQHVPNLD